MADIFPPFSFRSSDFIPPLNSPFPERQCIGDREPVAVHLKVSRSVPGGQRELESRRRGDYSDASVVEGEHFGIERVKNKKRRG